MNYKSIDPKEISTRDLHQYLLGCVAPRPIAFVSTLGKNGVQNLAPYSFFNAFSSNPPTLVFSSNRRVLNNTTKDTLQNVLDTKECVINVVNYDIVRQMAVTSVEFRSDESEFDKSGLTPIPSTKVKAARVAESPAQMECKVKDIITLGEHGGAGHLIVCEVVQMHINEEVIDNNNRIDPHKIDLMGRMGRAYYVRASGANVFPIVQAVTVRTIGYAALPESVRISTILTGNDLGILAGCTEFPDVELIAEMSKNEDVQQANNKKNITQLHSIAQEIIKEKPEDRDRALAVLMTSEIDKNG